MLVPPYTLVSLAYLSPNCYGRFVFVPRPNCSGQAVHEALCQLVFISIDLFHNIELLGPEEFRFIPAVHIYIYPTQGIA